jgi:hypothetical protein
MSKIIQLKMSYAPPRRVVLPYSIHQSAGPACHAPCGGSGSGDDGDGDDGIGDNGGGRGDGGLWRWRQF